MGDWLPPLILACFSPPIEDATEKVLILRKTVQDKVYLYVFHYYILYVKTVFQWRHRDGSHLLSDIILFLITYRDGKSSLI